MTVFDFLLFFGVIAFFIAVGIYKSKLIQTESAYLFGERSTKWVALTATLVMTEFNSATLISFSSLGYAAGFWALTLPFIFLIGLLFYAVTVAKKWKAFDGLSVAGFFSERYRADIGTYASLLLLLAMLGFSAAYIKSLILLFQPIFPFASPWTLSTSLVAIVLIMSLRGGLVAIIRTDLLSLALLLLFFPLMVFFTWESTSLSAVSSLSLTDGQQILPFSFIFSLTILTMFTYILAPSYGQKIFAAKSEKTAYWAVISAAIIVFFLYGSAIFATALFQSKGFMCASAEQALPSIIDQCLPWGFKGIAYALLFATSATTLTGVWNAMSAMWIGDFIKVRSEATPVGYGRSILVIVMFATISLLLANTFVDSVFDKLILANIPIAALSFGLLGGFYWKKTSWQGVYASIFMGCISGVGAYVIFGEEGGYTWYWAVYGIPITFFTGIVGSIMCPNTRLVHLQCHQIT